MSKCNYCQDTAVTVFEDEYLYNRHYDVLYKKDLKVIQVSEVPKTKLERKLNKKYMKLMDREITPDVVEMFKKDVLRIKKSNNE